MSTAYEHFGNTWNRKRLYAGHIGDKELWWSCFEAAGAVSIAWFESQDGFDRRTTPDDPVLHVQYVKQLKTLWYRCDGSLDDSHVASKFIKACLIKVWGSYFSAMWDTFTSRNARNIFSDIDFNHDKYFEIAKSLATKSKQDNQDGNSNSESYRKRLHAGNIGAEGLWWSCFEVGDAVRIVWIKSPDGSDEPSSICRATLLEVHYVERLRRILKVYTSSFGRWDPSQENVRRILIGIWGSCYGDEWNKFRSEDAASITREIEAHKADYLRAANVLTLKAEQSIGERNTAEKVTTRRETSCTQDGAAASSAHVTEALVPAPKHSNQEENLPKQITIKKEIDAPSGGKDFDSTSSPNHTAEAFTVATSTTNTLKREMTSTDSSNKETTRKKVRGPAVVIDLEASPSPPHHTPVYASLEAQAAYNSNKSRGSSAMISPDSSQTESSSTSSKQSIPASQST